MFNEMKKKIAAVCIVTALVLCASFKVLAMHHYGFILSCGREVYLSQDSMLSDCECLDIWDRLDGALC